MTDLATLLADPSQAIAFVVELAYRDPDTDTYSTVRITSENWEGAGEAGYLRGLLDDPGDQAIEVEVEVGGGIAKASLGPMRFLNQPPSIGAAGPLDFLRTKTLGGRAVTLYAGAPDEAIANYEQLGSGLADGEPEFDDEGGYMTLRRKTALELLRQDLDVGTYVGEPGALRILTGTGQASTSPTAAHDLTEFTLAFRFRQETQTSGTTFSRKIASGSSQNWNVRFNGTSGGAILARYTSGTLPVDLLDPVGGRDDGEYHWCVFARRSGHRYLMIDGEVVAESSTGGAPDTPSAGTTLSLNWPSGSDGLDWRILDHYTPPDESRTWMATRATGDEEGLVGLWRSDEATGSTLTDYSPTGANASITGTEGVDFEHVSSDLGEAEIAGQAMAVIFGSVYNAPADLVSSVFERWRVLDRPGPGSFSTQVVRDEGDELTVTTDYDWALGGDVIALVAEAGEPLTVGIDLGASDTLESILSDSATGHLTLLVDRGPLSASEVEAHRLASLYPNSMGLWTRRRPVAEIASEILRGNLGHAALRRDGTLSLDALTSPVSPSPRSGPCVEISSSAIAPARITWASAGALASRDFTMAAWVRTLRTSPTTLSAGRIPLIEMSDGATTDQVYFMIQVKSGVPTLGLYRFTVGSGFAAGSEAAIGQFLASPWDWWFVAVAHDHAGGSTTFYAAPAGQSLGNLGSDGAIGLTGTPVPDFVHVGGLSPAALDRYFRGSIFEPQIWDGVRSQSELQSAMDDGLAGTETDLVFYASLAGTEAASLTDVPGSISGSITGDVVERPDLVVDLAVTPRPFRRRNLTPAKSIDVRYRKNWARLTTEQIAAAVPRDERLALQQEWLSVPWDDPDLEEDYADARDIELDSMWYERDGAEATMRLARLRYGPGAEFAVLGPTDDAPLREGLLLEVCDEVQVKGYQDLAGDGKTYRVVGNRRLIGAFDSELSLWAP